MSLDEVAHDGQADAEPALRAIDRLPLLDEQIEDVRQHLGRDANAGVTHAQDHFMVDGLAADGNVPSRRGVLGGVGEQVRNHLAEPRDVGIHQQAASRHLDRQRVISLLEQRARHFDGLRDDFRNLDEIGFQFDLAARDPRHVEKIVDQPRQVGDLAFDHGAGALGFLGPLQLHQLQRGDNGRQRIAKLVPQHGEELVLRAIGALRRPAQPVHLGQRLMRLDQVAHANEQVLFGERLDDEVLRAVIEELDLQLVVGLGREEQDRRLAELRQRAQLRDHLVAAHVRHHDVRDDQVGPEPQRLFETLTSI